MSTETDTYLCNKLAKSLSFQSVLCGLFQCSLCKSCCTGSHLKSIKIWLRWHYELANCNLLAVITAKRHLLVVWSCQMHPWQSWSRLLLQSKHSLLGFLHPQMWCPWCLSISGPCSVPVEQENVDLSSAESHSGINIVFKYHLSASDCSFYLSARLDSWGISFNNKACESLASRTFWIGICAGQQEVPSNANQ